MGERALPGDLGVALVADHDRQPGDQERGLLGAGVDLLEVDLGIGGEDLPVGPEPHARAGLGPRARSGLTQARLLRELRVGPLAVEQSGNAAAEGDQVDPGVAVDLDVQSRAQRVDHAGAHAVQAARGRVRATAELAAGVQLGHDDLDAGQAGPRLHVHRDATPVVVHLDGPIGPQDHVDPGAPPAQGLVDRVVQDLPQAVHQATGIRRPDVHAGALAHGLEALEDRQVLRGVPGGGLLGAPRAAGRLQGFCGHRARVPGGSDSRWSPSHLHIPWRVIGRMQVARLANVPADVSRRCHTGDHGSPRRGHGWHSRDGGGAQRRRSM